MGALRRPCEFMSSVSDPARAANVARVCAEARDRCLQPVSTPPETGDQKPPAVAQAYRQQLPCEARAISDATWVSSGFPAPVGRLWEGSCVGDMTVLLMSVECNVSGLAYIYGPRA